MSTWLLLRGLTRERRHWGDFPATLQARCPGAEVLAIDLPGNGSLNHERSPTQVPEMAEACRRQLLERGIAPPFRLVAMSLGAMVAIDWACRHPQEIAGCVLINTSLRRLSPFHHRLKPRNYLRLASLLLPWRDPARREGMIWRMTSNRSPRPDILADWSDFARRNPVSAANALRQLIAAMRHAAPVSRPQVPVLILGSAGDRLVDPRCSARLAALWQCAFAEHPAAGHDLPLDDAPWVAEQIARWRDALSAAPGQETA